MAADTLAVPLAGSTSIAAREPAPWVTARRDDRFATVGVLPALRGHHAARARPLPRVRRAGGRPVPHMGGGCPCPKRCLDSRPRHRRCRRRQGLRHGKRPDRRRGSPDRATLEQSGLTGTFAAIPACPPRSQGGRREIDVRDAPPNGHRPALGARPGTGRQGKSPSGGGYFQPFSSIRVSARLRLAPKAAALIGSRVYSP